MPPKLLQAANRYSHALDFAPPPGFPSRWPPGTPSHWSGPLRSPAIKHLTMRSLAPRKKRHVTLGDGDGIGGWFDDTLSAAGNAVLGPAQQKLDRLEMAIKTILALSAVAAATGLINVVRR